MATYISILAWRIPWTEEPGWATVHGVAQELNLTKQQQWAFGKDATEVKHSSHHISEPHIISETSLVMSTLIIWPKKPLPGSSTKSPAFACKSTLPL